MGKGEGLFRWRIPGLGKNNKAPQDPNSPEASERARAEIAAQQEATMAEISKQRLEAQRVANKWEILEAQMKTAAAATQEVTAKEDEGWITQGYAGLARQYITALENLVVNGRLRVFKLQPPDVAITQDMLRDGIPASGTDPVESVTALNKLIQETRETLKNIESDKRTVQNGLADEIRELNETRVKVLGTNPIGPDGKEIVSEGSKKNNS